MWLKVWFTELEDAEKVNWEYFEMEEENEEEEEEEDNENQEWEWYDSSWESEPPLIDFPTELQFLEVS